MSDRQCNTVCMYSFIPRHYIHNLVIWISECRAFKDWQLKEYEPRTFIKLYKETRFQSDFFARAFFTGRGFWDFKTALALRKAACNTRQIQTNYNVYSQHSKMFSRHMSCDILGKWCASTVRTIPEDKDRMFITNTATHHP